MNRDHYTDNEVITIRGLIIPADWDEKGTVTAVALSAFDETEYLISAEGKGEELLNYLRKEVEVDGILSKEKDGRIIKIERYTL